MLAGYTDFVMNGAGHGEFGSAMHRFGFDHNLFRPYFNEQGIPCVNRYTGKTIIKDGRRILEKEVVPIAEMFRRGKFNPTFNATSLRRDDWIYYDKKLVEATRTRLRAWSDLAAASSVGGFDALAKMTYEYEAMSDTGEVMVSMDGRGAGRDTGLDFVQSSVPLPIYHVDFTLGLRQDLVSRNSGIPLSTTRLEQAGRRIAERVEGSLIGLFTGPTYGTRANYFPHREASTVYGYTTHPSRQTKTDLTTPTGSNPQATVDDVLEMRDLMYDAGFYGPFMLYHSTDWDLYLDDDYGQTTGSSYGFAPTKTLRQRLKDIEGIRDVRRLDMLTPTSVNGGSANPFTLLLVQMTSDVAEAIDGAAPRIQQWETKGGWELNFRVWAIQTQVLKYDYNGNMGLVHATTS